MNPKVITGYFHSRSIEEFIERKYIPATSACLAALFFFP